MKHFTTILFWLITCHALSQHVKERVILFPDRNLYISGEPVHFSALIRQKNDSTAVSSILYCEIITPGGRRIAGGKYDAINSTVSGTLVIPQDLITGVYYLKAYTRLMRNEGPSVYSYDIIKVINPVREEVIGGTGDKPIDVEDDLTVILDTLLSNPVKIPAGIQPGDTVKIMIEDPQICRALKNLTISVIPGFTLSNRIISPLEQTLVKDNTYLAETEGILITGIVKNRSDGNTIPGIRVNLSVIGEGRDFMSVTTGNDGKFVFIAPGYTGNRDIFLCTGSSDSLDAQIIVDNDFCNLPLILPEAEFNLSGDERETALRMAVNFRLEQYFNADTATTRYQGTEETPAFYGKPDEILAMDEYVELPTLEEYFNQLPVPVKVRKRSGQKYFKVLGTQAELMDIDPLVMIDLVVIDDIDKILALDPGEIRRIDIVNALYVKADIIYGGIVNLISRDGDFAGINLPESGVFINYSFLSETGYSTVKPGVNSPDTRNTVFWKTLRNPDECSGISFIAPPTPGRYLVVLRGVDKMGEEVRGSFSFIVERH